MAASGGGVAGMGGAGRRGALVEEAAARVSFAFTLSMPWTVLLLSHFPSQRGRRPPKKDARLVPP